MSNLSVNVERLLDGRIRALGKIGRDADDRLTSLASSDADRAGRDQFVAWFREAELNVAVSGGIRQHLRRGPKPLWSRFIRSHRVQPLC